MAAMTSFYAEKCCHLLSENETSAAAFRQFLINSTFVVVRSGTDLILLLILFLLLLEQPS